MNHAPNNAANKNSQNCLMRVYAEEHLGAGMPMAGLLLVDQDYPLGKAIEDLTLIGEATLTFRVVF